MLFIKSSCIILIIFISAFACLVLAGAPKSAEKAALTPKDKTEISGLINKYFGSGDAAEKQQILDDLARYDGRLSQGDIDYFAQLCWPLAANGAKINGQSPVKCTNPEYPGEYVINLPSGAKKEEPTGVFIGLHGASGSAKNMFGFFGTPNPRLITVYPEVLNRQDKMNGWTAESAEHYIMEIIADLKRSFNIDTNRIYLAGFSMGGFGAWSIGTDYADMFGAISPMSGGISSRTEDGKSAPAYGTAANLKNTGIWFCHGADDNRVPVEMDRVAATALQEYQDKFGPYDFVYKEYKTLGHKLPSDGLKQVWDWLFTRKRNPYPKQVIWEPRRAYKKIFYWLKVNDPRQSQRIEAKIDGNKILVQTNVDNLTIFLNNKMVNLSKPVSVEINGAEVFNGVVNYSISALLETIDEKKDPEMYFTGRIIWPSATNTKPR